MAFLIGRCGSLYVNQQRGKLDSDAFFPGQTIANIVTHHWQKKTCHPLKYIVGSHYLISNIVVYSNKTLIPYSDASHEKSPWIDLEQLKRHGAMVAVNGKAIPSHYYQQFPTLQSIKRLTVTKSNTHHAETVSLGYIPPLNTSDCRAP